MAAVILVLASTAALAQAAPLESFAGTFNGTGMSETRDGRPAKVNARDFDVHIAVNFGGFSISWRSIEFRLKPGENRAEARQDTINFVRAARPGLYRAVEKSDPVGGEPVYWARLAGNTLTVRGMVVDAQGAVEVTTWERTVTGRRMDLVFRREVNGSTTRTVKGVLIKTSE